MDGEIFAADQRLNQPKNTVMIGECAFTLRYVGRTPEKNDQFQVELAQVFREFHRDHKQLNLPTPNENLLDFAIGSFNIGISKGASGTVYMVINVRMIV